MGRRKRKIDRTFSYQNGHLCTFNFNFLNFPTGAGAPQLYRRARTPRKRACATLGAF
jgi:hypothetical protein